MDTRRLMTLGATFALAGALLLSSGCVRVELDNDADTSHETESIALKGADEVRVDVRMGAGELTIGSASTVELMDAEFDFRPSSLRPDVDYSVSGGVGDLRVLTPNNPQLNFGVNSMYRWDLRFAEDVPMEMDIDMGAGQASLDLGGLLLKDLKVDLGAGDATIDLSGEPRGDLEADINAGVGQLTLIVPRDAGVRIIGYKDGLGSYQADGFTIDGDYLVNDAYGDADVTYDIVLRRGVGEVIIRMAD